MTLYCNLPFHTDGNQREWTWVDGGWLHERDDVADDFAEREAAKREENDLKKKKLLLKEIIHWIMQYIDIGKLKPL